MQSFRFRSITLSGKLITVDESNNLYVDGDLIGGLNISSGSLLWNRDESLSGSLDATGQYLLDQITISSNGVASLNSLSGIIGITGAGNIEVTTSVDTIYISGDFVSSDATGSFITQGTLNDSGSLLWNRDEGLSSNISSLSGQLTSLSGDLVNYVPRSETGQFASTQQVQDVADNLGASGLTLWNRDLGLSSNLALVSGDLTSSSGNLLLKINSLSAGQTTLNGLSGAVQISGAGSINIAENGQILVVSGTPGGGGAGNVLSINGVTGLIQLTGSGDVEVLADGTTFRIGGDFVSPSETGGFLDLSSQANFVLKSETGQFASDIDVLDIDLRLHQTGQTLFDRDSELSSNLATISGLIGGGGGAGNVVSINGVTGFIELTGSGNVEIDVNGTVFSIGGTFVTPSDTGFLATQDEVGAVSSSIGASGLTLWARDLGLSDSLSLLSGQIVFKSETGQFASDIEISNLDLRLVQSGDTLWARDAGLSDNIVTLSGNVVFQSDTGQFASDLDITNVIAQFNSTGLVLYNRDIELSNNIATLSGQVAAIESISGNFYLNSNPSGFITGNQALGLPTDGSYGGSNGAIAGVAQGDSSEDAFDKVEVILGKLAPSRPSNLSEKSLSFESSTYSANMQGTSSTFSNVTSDTTPSVNVTGFYDGDDGILTAYVNELQSGQITITTSDDTATDEALDLYDDEDFWLGVAGREGFWRYLSARITPTAALPTGEFSALLDHSLTGPTDPITGYVDNPVTPSVSNITNFTGSHTVKWLDGVPSFDTNSVVGARFDVSNAVGAFYNSTRVGRVESSYTTDTNIAATGSPINGGILHPSGTVLVEVNKYTESLVLTCRGYSSNGATASSTTNTNVRIDTLSNQQAQRVRASVGQYPTTGYGTAYDNTLSLVSNEELQLLNRDIRYPSLTNYSADLPVGPNYSSLPVGSYDNYRWACYNMGTISADSSITIQFNNTTNFGTSTIFSDMKLYARVDGATPTNGWLDGNAAYPGVGNPLNDGDPALVVGSSDQDTKVITFGTAPKDGTVYIRIGIRSTSTKRYRTISMS